MTLSTQKRTLAVAIVVAGAAGLVRAQKPDDWPVHNHDVRNTRYAPHAQVNTTNVQHLTVKWTFEVPRKESIASMTPVVVDGVMYFNSGSNLYAVDAETGATRWT